MKIVITGNMGYVGPRVLARLRATRSRAELVGFDAGWFSSILTAASTAPEVALDSQLFGDVRTPPSAVFDGTDAIVHLAGLSNDPIGQRYEALTMDINCDATVALARKAKEAGVRSFVFASSCSVYGHAEETPRTESSAVEPLTAYARSKVAAERGLAELADARFRVTCLRFATACGMSERLRLDLVLNQFVAFALASGEIRVLSNGSPRRPLIDVNDMARAIDWAITREEGDDALVINAGHDDANYTVRDIAESVAKAIPGSRVSINVDAPPDKRSYIVDFSLYRKFAPAHQCVVSLAASIASVRDGLRAMGFDQPDVEQTDLIRLRTLRLLQEQGYLRSDLYWNRST
jgi:nucleoside-diphosphate-sugar epimerase